MIVKSYNLTTDSDIWSILVIGSSNNSIIRSLEMSNYSGSDAVVDICRKDEQLNFYGNITLSLVDGDYVTLFIGSHLVLQNGHVLQVKSNIAGIDIVANVVEL